MVQTRPRCSVDKKKRSPRELSPAADGSPPSRPQKLPCAGGCKELLDVGTDTIVPCKGCGGAICNFDYGPVNVSCSDPCCKCGIVLCKGCIEANGHFPRSYFGNHPMCGKRKCADRFDREGGDNEDNNEDNGDKGSEEKEDNEEGDGEGGCEEDNDDEDQWGFVKCGELWLTRLQRAVIRGDVDEVNARLKAREDPNALSELDFPTIAFAVESPNKFRNREIVKALLSYGADPTQTDRDGEDAYTLATDETRAWLPKRDGGDKATEAGVKRSSPSPSPSPSPPPKRPHKSCRSCQSSTDCPTGYCYYCF